MSSELVSSELNFYRWFRGLTTLKEFKDIFCKFKYLQNYMAMAMNHGCMHMQCKQEAIAKDARIAHQLLLSSLLCTNINLFLASASAVYAMHPVQAACISEK
jgi:hypothetical protein